MYIKYFSVYDQRKIIQNFGKKPSTSIPIVTIQCENLNVLWYCNVHAHCGIAMCMHIVGVVRHAAVTSTTAACDAVCSVVAQCQKERSAALWQ